MKEQVYSHKIATDDELMRIIEDCGGSLLIPRKSFNLNISFGFKKKFRNTWQTRNDSNKSFSQLCLVIVRLINPNSIYKVNQSVKISRCLLTKNCKSQQQTVVFIIKRNHFVIGYFKIRIEEITNLIFLNISFDFSTLKSNQTAS